MPRDDEALLDILKAARRSIEFMSGMDRAEFLRDPKTQSAVLHQLLLLGEAVKRLSQGFRGLHREVPWRMASGMRDKLIHRYHEVDLDEVWKTVAVDMPELIAALETLATGEEQPPP